MPTFTMILIFAVMIIMALSIIVLVIWVARLSQKLRNLSDVIFTGDGPAGAAAGVAMGAPTQQPSVTGRIQNAMHVAQDRTVGAAGPAGSTGSAAQPAANPAVNPAAPAQQAYRPAAPAAAGAAPVQASSSAQKFPGQGEGLLGSPDDGSDFFDRYKQHENPNPAGFGRQKPSIPFGEDKTVVRKRDTYAETAVDYEYDPDSIDFSRVAGYRNLYNNQQ